MKILLLILLLLVSTPVFAQTGVKISDMPSGGDTAEGDFVPVVRSGVNFKTLFNPVTPSGSFGNVQTNLDGSSFGSFSLNATSGTGSSSTGVLLNNGGVTQALSIGTNDQGWTNQISPASTAANAMYQISQGLYIDPRNFGAVCNTQYADGRTYVPHALNGVILTAGSPVISITGYAFKSSDIGKFIAVNAGFGGDAGVATGTIVSIGAAGSTATMSVTPTVSAGNGVAIFGSDDTAGFVAAANQAILQGGYVIVPSGCAVRELHLPNFVTLQGQAVETGYNYAFITPVMYVLATGFTEDATSYGINISNNEQVALSGFEIRGPVSFPAPATVYPNEKLSLVGTDSGTMAVRSGIAMDHMDLQQGFTCFGSRINLAANTGHIFFESRFSEYSTCAWGMHGGFSDGMEIGDVFTGNHQGYGDAYWGPGGGFNTTAMRLIGVRMEEGGGLYCDSCSGNHLEGTEFQFEEVDHPDNGFTTGNSLTLHGQWDSFWMTGGFFETNNSTSKIPVKIAGGENFSHPLASFVNVLFSGNIAGIDNEITPGTGNPEVAYLGGIAYSGSFTENPITGPNFVWPSSTAGPLFVLKYQPANTSAYIAGTGVTDYTVNVNQALGLQTTSAVQGSILDAHLASTTTNSSIVLPNGTTGNRPPSPINGMMRYNTSTNTFEGYAGGWGSLGGGAGPIVIKTANYTVLALDNNSTFTNTGATGSVTFTLPTAAAALSYCFYVDTAQTFVIAADSGHTIRNGLSVTSSGGNFTSNTIGNQMCLRALNGTEWYVYSGPTGSWTVN